MQFGCTVSSQILDSSCHKHMVMLSTIQHLSCHLFTLTSIFYTLLNCIVADLSPNILFLLRNIIKLLFAL
jgi:hypothetical protein